METRKLQPFEITIYKTEGYDAKKVRFWYDEYGVAQLWEIKGLRNGGHEFAGYSDTFDTENYARCEGVTAFETAVYHLTQLLALDKEEA